MGCGQVKEPLRIEERVGPALMVAPASAPGSMVSFAENAAQPHAKPLVERDKGAAWAVLKICQPPPQRAIDVLDDDGQCLPIGTAGFGAQRVFELVHTLRSRPVITPFKVIAKKVKAAALRG